MEIVKAESAGFCFGVKRALDTVYKELEKEPQHIYTYGPIIHNEIVVKELEDRGVVVIEEGEDLSKYAPGVIIIRSHGVPEQTILDLEERGFTVVNATCPFVQKIQRSVKKYDLEDYKIVITGDINHPEVRGIIGWIGSDEYTVIKDVAEAEALSFDEGEKVCLVSQTTFNFKKFEDIVEIIRKKGYDLLCLNTICNATWERQKEAREVEICKEKNEDTYFIQTVDDLDFSVLKSIDSVGITAGASTPNKIIEEVQGTCQKKALNRCLKHQ